MKIKKEFEGKVIGRRVNGKMIEFDARKVKDYSFYINNGFSDLFEKDDSKEESDKIDSKVIYFTNDSMTPILKESSPEPKKKKNYDVPNDKRNKK